MRLTPPPKFGKIIEGKYVWSHSKPLPKYFNNGMEFIPHYLPYGTPGKYNFYMGDNEKFYNENLKTMPEDWYYRNKSVEYNLNNLGYRGHNFDTHDWKNSIVVLGCSCVFGVGVDESETLTSQISKITGRNVINLGIGGGSNQLLLDTSLIMKKKYGTPYSLIVMWSTSDRLTYYGNEKQYNIGVWNHSLLNADDEHIHYKEIFDSFFKEASHENITLYNIVQAMRGIWEDKTKYFDGSFFEPTAHYGQLPFYSPFSNTARDLMHPGPNDYKNTAEQLVEHFVKKYGKDYLQPRGLGLNIKLL